MSQTIRLNFPHLVSSLKVLDLWVTNANSFHPTNRGMHIDRNYHYYFNRFDCPKTQYVKSPLNSLERSMIANSKDKLQNQVQNAVVK